MSENEQQRIPHAFLDFFIEIEDSAYFLHTRSGVTDESPAEDFIVVLILCR